MTPQRPSALASGSSLATHESASVPQLIATTRNYRSYARLIQRHDALAGGLAPSDEGLRLSRTGFSVWPDASRRLVGDRCDVSDGAARRWDGREG
jgi:hypothetical protein